jgi:hypothetical protein
MQSFESCRPSQPVRSLFARAFGPQPSARMYTRFGTCRPPKASATPCARALGFTSRQCQRHQGLAVRGLAQRRSILRSDTHRMRAFLGYRGVVDHQHGITAADELIRLNQQFCFRRPGKRIIELAKAGERNADRLCEYVLAKVRDADGSTSQLYQSSSASRDVAAQAGFFILRS